MESAVGSPLRRALGPDLFRSLAILLVMLWHLPHSATPELFRALKPYGWLGVDIFFVLSGYLIGTQLFREVARTGDLRIGRFYANRALRILPAYFVVLVFYLAVPSGRELPAMDAWWRFATFTMNFSQSSGAFSHAWSLCVEEHFYLVLPLLTLFLRGARLRLVAGIVIAIFVGGICLRIGIWERSIEPLLADKPGGVVFAAYLRELYYPTYCRLDGLAAGAALAAIRVYRPVWWATFARPRTAAIAGAAFAVAGWGLLQLPGPMSEPWLPVLPRLATALFAPCFALACACWLACSFALERVSQMAALRAIATAVATLAYSLYLTHKPVMAAVRSTAPAGWAEGWVGLAVYLAASFLAATLLWFAVERPFLILRERWLHGHLGATHGAGRVVSGA